MRRIVGIVVVAAIAVAIAWWVAGLSGQVGVTIAGTTVEASAPVAVLFFALCVLLVYLVIRIIGAIFFGIPFAIGQARRRGRRGRGETAVTRTLVALAASDRREARHEAARARRLLGDTPQTLLLAAEASRLSGDEAAAAALYETIARRDDAAFLGLRGLFRQAMAREDWPAAARIADRAEQVHPGAAWLREERTELAIRTGNWTQALRLAGPEIPAVALRTAVADNTADPKRAVRLAREAFQQDPAFAPGVLAYARRLRAAGRERKALDAVRTGWQANPHPDLAAFYLEPARSPQDRLTAAQKLAAANPVHPETLLLLARLSLEAGRVADARRQAEAARAEGFNQRRLWLLLADIEAAERPDTEAGRAAQADALRHAAAADPDPQWRCENCGTVHRSWHPACPVCHAAGRIAWGPPRVAVEPPPPPPAPIAPPPEPAVAETAPAAAAATAEPAAR